MPTKLTKEQLDQIKYVSVADLKKRLDEISDIDDKRRFAARYLARHGMDGKPDYTLAEATHMAKMSIGLASANAKKAFYQEMEEDDLDPADYYIGDTEADEDRYEVVNPYAPYYEDDVANEYFMGHTSDYLKNTAKEIANSVAPENRNIIGAEDEMNKYLSQADEFNPTLEKEILKLGEKPNTFEIRYRIDQKLGKAGALNELYNETKPTFGASFFRTTSRASKNLDVAYKAFNNPNHAMYGDLATIEKAGFEYLEHKFPGWKRGMELPSEEQINRLSGTSKARALLSVNLINAVKEQREELEARKGVTEMITVAHHIEYSWNKVKEAEEKALKEEKKDLEEEELDDSNSELDNSDDDIENDEIEVKHKNKQGEERSFQESLKEDLEDDNEEINIEKEETYKKDTIKESKEEIEEEEELSNDRPK